jgi:hypothetical protein
MLSVHTCLKPGSSYLCLLVAGTTCVSNHVGKDWVFNVPQYDICIEILSPRFLSHKEQVQIVFKFYAYCTPMPKCTSFWRNQVLELIRKIITNSSVLTNDWHKWGMKLMFTKELEDEDWGLLREVEEEWNRRCEGGEKEGQKRGWIWAKYMTRMPSIVKMKSFIMFNLLQSNKKVTLQKQKDYSNYYVTGNKIT